MKLCALTVLIASMLLSACNTSPTTVRANLLQELQQYIGQPAAEIQQKLNLRALGYKVREAPVLTNTQLSYTVLRSINIPVAQPVIHIATHTGTHITHSPSLPPSSHESTDLKCTIIFNLKEGVAESLQYTGKAC